MNFLSDPKGLGRLCAHVQVPRASTMNDSLSCRNMNSSSSKYPCYPVNSVQALELWPSLLNPESFSIKRPLLAERAHGVIAGGLGCGMIG